MLFAGYQGMAGGNALANVIFGKVNPSGKLPYSIFERESDYPLFPGGLNKPVSTASDYVGVQNKAVDQSIADCQLVGNSKYHKGDENSYNDYGLTCDKEKYKLDVASKKFSLSYQSDVMKQNQTTGQKEKVEVVK